MKDDPFEAGDEAYVGTLVGESTSREFRLAVAHGAVREQDLIAVDAEFPSPDGSGPTEQVRVWAKVQRIERINPLFPAEAGHELAETRTDPLDTVLSLSRELVSAVCQVLGAEPLAGGKGRLDHLRYPARPATNAYRPSPEDVARVVLGDLRDESKRHRALDLATLANRPEVDVLVDGHDIVLRHLAILAMTGSGKSWTARRIIEQLADKDYPIVIFDPHGDYTGLADIPEFRGRVERYYAQLPIFEEDSETVAKIVDTLGYELSPTMRGCFDEVFKAAKSFVIDDQEEMTERVRCLAGWVGDSKLIQYGVRPDLWLVANLAEAAERLIDGDTGAGEADEAQFQLKGGARRGNGKELLAAWAWEGLLKYKKSDVKTLGAIKKRTRSAAKALWRMEQTNQRIAGTKKPLPTDRTELVRHGGISVVSLAGYTGDFQATIYSLIAEDLFDARVRDELKWPMVLVLEEAHNFAPAKAATPAEQRAVATTKQIAQEGRKFRVGLILISQRPSRLDETTLAMCNSFVIMRMVNPADQNFVRKVIETLGEDEARMLPDLDVGEAVLSGQMVNFPVLVRIKPPTSQGEREEEDAFDALAKARQQAEFAPQERRKVAAPGSRTARP